MKLLTAFRNSFASEELTPGVRLIALGFSILTFVLILFCLVTFFLIPFAIPLIVLLGFYLKIYTDSLGREGTYRVWIATAMIYLISAGMFGIWGLPVSIYAIPVCISLFSLALIAWIDLRDTERLV